MKINCSKCGKELEMDLSDFTCADCTSKEFEEDLGDYICDNCGKNLFGRTADQEITLFYKDADKDYNFCSKECLIKFVKKLK
jgi:DNA-directed RNA polymerase subunit RPC12/RpoP